MAVWRVITLAFATSIFAEAKWYHHQKRETSSNICDPVYNNTNAVQCYCAPGQTMEMVRSANCHLVKKDLDPDDRSWNLFNALKDINKVTFSNTRGIALTYIPTNALKLMPKLTKVDIKYGNIDMIEAFAFANLSQVEEVTLSDNQIRVLGKNAFTHHKELITIGLDTNNLMEINRDVFVDLPSLEKLYFTNNKITTIHDKAFLHLVNLIELEIDRNSLFSLNSETFSGLARLQKLDLSGNSLEVIGDNTFLPLTSLRTLNLEENKIQMLDEKAFNGLGQLNALTLAHNKLTSINNDKTFEDMESLTQLSLKSNQLVELSARVMSPILSNFYGNTSNLDVEDNSFPCDCRLEWFMTLMNKTQNSHLKLATENLKCIPNAILRDLWAKTEDTEKSTSQVVVDEETQVQNTDYEYYDEAQLNGKLFYFDVREMANCTNTSQRAVVPKKVETKTPANTIEAAPKLTTKVSSSPATTSKSATTTEDYIILESSKATTKQSVALKIPLKKTENEPNETKNKESFTTVRLATVSAKPSGHNDIDQDMASDEAKPEKITAHRSIQDLKNTPKWNYNNACRNANNVALALSMILCLRFYFY